MTTYIGFAEFPDAPGRQYRDVAFDPASLRYVAAVDDVLAGEAVITPEEHVRVMEKAVVAYAREQEIAAQAPVEPAVAAVAEPPLSQDELAALRALIDKV